jgi:ketosteroid isomerase-like protein
MEGPKMSRLETLVRRYYEAFNNRDFGAYEALFSADCRIESPGVSEHGVAAMRSFDRDWIATFPEARIESMRMTSTARHVASGNWFHAGPQRGPLPTPNGTIAPTGKVLSAPYCAMFEIENDRIVRQVLAFAPEFIPAQLVGS